MTETMLYSPETESARQGHDVDPRIPAVNAFWRQAGIDKWFAKDPVFDTDFRQRFEALHFAGASRELDHWIDTAEGALTLIVLLDQFPRNSHRNTGAHVRHRLACAALCPDRGRSRPGTCRSNRRWGSSSIFPSSIPRIPKIGRGSLSFASRSMMKPSDMRTSTRTSSRALGAFRTATPLLGVIRHRKSRLSSMTAASPDEGPTRGGTVEPPQRAAQARNRDHHNRSAIL
jgi:uncharacterized protein DUF924